MNCGLVALENPDSPNAPNQRYGLTLKGKALYYERHDNENDVQNDPQRIQIDPQNDPQTNLEGQPDPLNEELDHQKTAIIKAIKENNYYCPLNFRGRLKNRTDSICKSRFF